MNSQHITIDPDTGDGNNNIIKIIAGLNPKESEFIAGFSVENSGTASKLDVTQSPSNFDLLGNYNAKATTIGTSEFSGDVTTLPGGSYEFRSYSQFTLVDTLKREYLIDEFTFAFEVDSNHIVSKVFGISSVGGIDLSDENTSMIQGLFAANGKIGIVLQSIYNGIPKILLELTKT